MPRGRAMTEIIMGESWFRADGRVITKSVRSPLRARARELEVFQALHSLQMGVVTRVTLDLRMSKQMSLIAFRNRCFWLLSGKA